MSQNSRSSDAWKIDTKTTSNRVQFSDQSAAEMAELPSGSSSSGELQQRDGTDTVNRYSFSSHSVADMKAVPSPLSPKLSAADRQPVNRNCFTPKDLQNLNDVPSSSSSKKEATNDKICESDSQLTQKDDESSRYSESEIEEINALPEIVPSDFVIGKRLLDAEELEDLKMIPSICSMNDDMFLCFADDMQFRHEPSTSTQRSDSELSVDHLSEASSTHTCKAVL